MVSVFSEKEKNMFTQNGDVSHILDVFHTE